MALNHDYHRLSYEFVKEQFENRGCVLLSKTYKNNLELLDYICICGKQNQITYCNFKAGKLCRQCYIDRNKGEKNYLYRHDKERQRKEILFTKRNYDYLSRVRKRKNTKNDEYDLNQLGYTHIDLMKHLQNFTNWSSVSQDKWVIDHKFPIAAFVKYNIYDLKLINCLENLQPMSAKDNMSKNRYYDEKEFIAWLSTKGINIKENL